jgi:transposase
VDSLARLFRVDGYEVKDVKVSFRDKTVVAVLERSAGKSGNCHRCGCFLDRKRGQHRLRIQTLSVMGFATHIEFWRLKGHCSNCQKARSEHVSFLAEESPHLTQVYADWLGEMCEFAATSRVAEFCSQSNMRIRRVDFGRLRRLLKNYKIPEVEAISVDEVYARKKSQFKGESRDKRFFTVVSDLKTHRVIWVSEGRSKEALDQFFALIGTQAAKRIKVAAMDQYDGYAISVRENCPNAKVVWDRFHIMKGFEEALNEARKDLHGELEAKDPKFRLTMGRYRFLFLKKASRRTDEEADHISQVMTDNHDFIRLELIKERMLTFFDQPTEDDGKDVLDEITMWIWQSQFKPLMTWIDNLHKGWDTLKNYFQFRVTSALSEGQNNVIKSLKRRAFGFRNMDYFRLKIMQVCGYLNSRFVGKAIGKTVTVPT